MIIESTTLNYHAILGVRGESNPRQQEPQSWRTTNSPLTQSGWRDSNPRSHAPKARMLPTTPHPEKYYKFVVNICLIYDRIFKEPPQYERFARFILRTPLGVKDGTWTRKVSWFTVRRVYQFLYNHHLVGKVGFEPTDNTTFVPSPVSKAGSFNHSLTSRLFVWVAGFEPANTCFQGTPV